MMQTSAPALPLSRFTALATDNPLRAREHLSRLFRPHRIVLGEQHQGIDFRHNRADLGVMSINSLRYGCEVTVQAPTPVDSYLVKITLRGASEVRQGRDSYRTEAATVCVLNPTRNLVDHMSADFDMLIVQLDGPALRLALTENFGITPHQPLEFLPVTQGIDGPIGGFVRLVRAICDDLDAGNSSFSRAQIRTPLARTLMSLVLTDLPHSYSARLPSGDTPLAPRHIRAVEDYIDAHLADPISLDDLLAVSGSSARTLQTGFLRYRGTTPMRFLRDRRLDHARAEILRRPGARVTDIAVECGFSHLGRFAQQYGARFGEPPSRTRR
ncbi:MAG: AraC family transcriptional regulator [Chromatiales bacterium]|jgi:AraC-like DNA-binding protein|nr:AraC family transcriptional regulator [Chromatiales bacterium]